MKKDPRDTRPSVPAEELKELLEEVGPEKRTLTQVSQLWSERHPPEPKGRGRPEDQAILHWQEEARHRIREAGRGERKKVLGEVREWLYEVRGKVYSDATLTRWAKEARRYRLEDAETVDTAAPLPESEVERERRRREPGGDRYEKMLEARRKG